ncbi:MAG: hypothetical protein Q4G49_07590 [Paracoccus sp. (in: a-proteobacteria)]|nr:hypothetical protein [Paracoccus sp. (in: a-proteobacteria)]
MADGDTDWAALQRIFAGLDPAPTAPEVMTPELARDLAEERVAILEYCAGLDRSEAERIAFRAIRRR